MRKQVLMFVAQDPRLDPRVDWEAQLLAQNGYSVSLYGFYTDRATKFSRENYTIIEVKALEVISPIWILKSTFKHRLIPLHLFSFILAPAIFLSWLLVAIKKWAKRSRSKIYRLLKKVPLVFPVTRGAYRYIPRNRLETSIHNLKVFIWSVAHVYRSAITFWGEVEGKLTENDIVHCHDLDTLLFGVMLKKKYGCKVVYDAHEYWPYSYINAPLYHVAFYKMLEKNLIRRVDSSFTVNPLLAAEMSKAYGVQIGSITNAEPWSPKRGRLREKSAPSELPLRVIFQGGFAAGRGIEATIQAWSLLKDNIAVLLLRGPENAHKARCIELAAKLGVLDRSVFFLPPVSEEELVGAASAADVGLIPYEPICINHTFCCPNKLSQYMHAGLAILTNDLPFVSSIVRKFECGMVYDYKDPKSLASNVESLASDRHMLNSLRENALKYAEVEFNWETQSKPLVEAYASL